jgi:hypothetical protein
MVIDPWMLLPSGTPPGDPTTWMDDLAYRAKVVAFNDYSRRFKDDFRAALAAQIPDGMWARHLDESGPFADLPALGWADDPRGAYQVACGLSHYPALPAEAWPTFLWTRYSRASEDGETFEVDCRPLDLGRFSDTSSRDVDLLAGIVVLSCRLQRRRSLRERRLREESRDRRPGESMGEWGVRLGLRPGIGGQPIEAVGDGDDVDPRQT